MILIATIIVGFAVVVGIIVGVAYWTRPNPPTCVGCGGAATTHTTGGTALCPRCAARWFPRDE